MSGGSQAIAAEADVADQGAVEGLMTSSSCGIWPGRYRRQQRGL